MKCSDFEELLSAYANDELSRTQREFIDEHLSGCDSCRELLSEYIKVKQDVGQLRDLAPFPDFSRDIMLRISEKKNPSKIDVGNRRGITAHRIFDKRRWLSVSLAFILVLGLSLGWLFVSDNAEKVQAKEIVLQNSEIQALLDGYDLNNVKFSVENTGNGRTFVSLLSNSDLYVVAEVDTSTSEVVKLYVLVLDNEFKKNIIEIAGTDEEVQELLEQGAVFTGFKVSYGVMSSWHDYNNGEWQHSEMLQFIVHVRLTLNSEQWWYLSVNLETNNVVIDAGVLPGYHGYKIFSAILAYLVMAVSIAGIIGAVKDKKPAVVFVKILPLALFAWTIYVLFFNPILVDAAVFVVILILLVLGVVSGIVGIKKSTSKKGKVLPLTGVILCLIFTFMIILYFTQNSNYGFIPFYPMEIVIID
jgi:hypothetical protein